MKEYESIVRRESGIAEAVISTNRFILHQDVKTTRREIMDRLLKEKFAEMSRKFTLRVNGEDIAIRDLAKPVLYAVDQANTYITHALSTNPYASIAWAGVSLILPVSDVLSPPRSHRKF